MAHVNANVINAGFRAYQDNVAGGITSQTAIAAADTNWTQATGAKFHVAMRVTETAGGSANNYNYTLQYSLNGGTWTDISTTSPVQNVTPTNCTTVNGASYGTTALSNGATVLATEYDTSGSSASNISLTSQSYEQTSCLRIDAAQVANNDTIRLRLTNNGIPLNADTTIPTITVSEAPPAPISATATNTLGPVTVSATGNLVLDPINGTATNSLSGMSVSSTGTVVTPDLIESFDSNLTDTSLTLSNDNKTLTNTVDATNHSAFSETSYALGSGGKRYFEVETTEVGSGDSHKLGLAEVGSFTNNLELANFGTGTLAYRGFEGNVNNDNNTTLASYTAWGASFTTYTVMMAVDFDNSLVWFGLNGVWNGDPGAGTGGIDISGSLSGNLHAAMGMYNSTGSAPSITGHFTANDLTYLEPTGFTAWDGTNSSAVSNGTATNTLAGITTSAAGSVVISASATNTLDTLTVSSTGSLVGLDPINGTATNTLEGLSVNSTGLLPLEGLLDSSLEGISVSSIGLLPVKGSVTISLADITVTSEAALVNNGTATNTLEGLTSDAQGSLPIFATSTSTLEGMTSNAFGTSAGGGLLIVTLDGMSVDASGSSSRNATSDITLDALSSSATGTSSITGSLDVSLEGVTSESSSDLIIDGSSGTTLENLSVDSTAAIKLAAQSSVSLEGVSTESSATTVILASSETTLDGLTVTGIGGVSTNPTATVNIILQGVSTDSQASLSISGSLTSELEPLTSSSEAAITIGATVNITLAGMSSASGADLVIDSDVGTSLEPLQTNAEAKLILKASATNTLEAVTVTALGKELLNPIVTPPERNVNAPSTGSRSAGVSVLDRSTTVNNNSGRTATTTSQNRSV